MNEKYDFMEGNKMSDYKKQILSYYEGYTNRVGENNRAKNSRTEGLEFHYTEKALSEHVTNSCRVLELGCGTGHYGVYLADKCREYIGIDLFQPHIDIFQRKIEEQGLDNLSCQVGDATNLVGVEDNSFDVVCCLGPLYHLQAEYRELVVSECERVCKPGGVIFFAYINKIGVYVGACVHDKLREIYPNKKANDTVLALGVSDEEASPFYFTTPEEMEAVAVRHKLSKIRNMGTDFFITMSVVDNMDDERFKMFMELSDEMVNHESCTGMSNHALLICRKEGAR